MLQFRIDCVCRPCHWKYFISIQLLFKKLHVDTGSLRDMCLSSQRKLFVFRWIVIRWTHTHTLTWSRPFIFICHLFYRNQRYMCDVRARLRIYVIHIFQINEKQYADGYACHSPSTSFSRNFHVDYNKRWN